MPNKPKHFCNHAGCTELVDGAYCVAHNVERVRGQRSAYDKNRPAYYAWYDSARWIMLRKKMLAVYPFCVNCSQEGRTELAKIIDHIMPHKGDSRLFWNVENLQCLCKHCHAVKTSKEDSWNR
jgi:5-methylcytosine-specific restriction protein A